jgi:hypothetical protein
VQADGTVALRATYGAVSGSISLLVAQAPVVSITITVSTNPTASFQLTAIAQLADGSTQDVTSISAWDSSDTTLATVLQTGFIRVRGNGQVTFHATCRGVTGSKPVFVSLPMPAPVATP